MGVTTSISGANTKLAIKEETAWGAVPTGNWEQIPFISETIAARDDTSNTPVLGYGRGAQRDERDGVTVTGDIVMPADLTACGLFIKAMLGPAADTGTTDVTHVFSSDSFDLRSLSLEFQHPDAGPGTPAYRKIKGVLVNTMQLRIGGRGARPQITFGLIAIDEVFDNTSVAGTPTSILPVWFPGKATLLKKDGTVLGKVTDIALNYSNNWDTASTVGGGGLITEADPGMASVDGSMTVRSNDLTLYTAAAAGTLMDLIVGWQIDATHSLLFEVPQAELVRQGMPVAGPGAVSATYNLMGSKPTGGVTLKATLVNQRVSYGA